MGVMSDSDSTEEHATDGFADAMSKILNNKVSENQAPILAKRQTKQMKQLESVREEKRNLNSKIQIQKFLGVFYYFFKLFTTETMTRFDSSLRTKDHRLEGVCLTAFYV